MNAPRKTLEYRAAVTAGTLLVAVCLSSCASSPQLAAQWRDPALGARSGLLRGTKVLVVCDAEDVAVRQVCQQQLTAEVVARGATPVSGPAQTQAPPARGSDAWLLPSAQAADARAVLVLSLSPSSTDVSPGFSLGIGGFGFGRHSAGGVGVEAPIGGGKVKTGFSANGRVTDVASGKLAWTASAIAAPDADLNAQVAALCKALLDAAQGSGL